MVQTTHSLIFIFILTEMDKCSHDYIILTNTTHSPNFIFLFSFWAKHSPNNYYHCHIAELASIGIKSPIELKAQGPNFPNWAVVSTRGPNSI